VDLNYPHFCAKLHNLRLQIAAFPAIPVPQICDVVSTDTPSRPTVRQRGCNQGGHGQVDAAVERRLTVAVSWALARAATLDALEHFEESYALNEEFREWLVCLEERPDLLDATVLMVPSKLGLGTRVEGDGLLEI